MIHSSVIFLVSSLNHFLSTVTISVMSMTPLLLGLGRRLRLFFLCWTFATLGLAGGAPRKIARLVHLADSVVASHYRKNKLTSYVPLPLDKMQYTPSLLRHKFSSPDERNFLLEFYLRDCNVDRIAFDDFKSAADHNNTALVRHFLTPGVTFFLPTDSAQPVHWLVRDLLSIMDDYNASTSDYQFIHLSDETYSYQHPNLLRFYSKWKKVYRHNWWNITEYRELHANQRLDWIPLTQLRSLFLQSQHILPPRQRKFNITFRGNTNTNAKRSDHVKEIQKGLGFPITGGLFKSGDHSRDPTLKLLSKATSSKLMSLESRNDRMRNKGTDTRGKPHNRVVSSAQSTYLHEMASSIFCLNLKGRMPECHRLYEALDCGCIPVFIDNFRNAHYARVFEGWKSKLMEVEWRKGHELPFVWAHNVSHFVNIFHNFVNNGSDGWEQLNVLQRDNLEWWKVAQHHIKQHFENAFCSF